MYYLLAFIFAYLFYTSAVLIRNYLEFRPAGALKTNGRYRNSLKVSLLIPARNEEAVIERCVISALHQNYDNIEVLVLDDESEDRTGSILRLIKSERDKNNKLRIINGKGPLPDWLGKPRACQQLADASYGELLIFIDADTWLEPGAITEIVDSFETEQLDAITVWPQQHLGTFWEKTALPLVYFALTTLLPAVYVKRDPSWLPGPLRPKFRTAFAAACGQCIGFRREVYNAIGGHSCVKQQIVEDVELSKILKSNGFRLAMYHGVDQVHCRMYTDHNSMREGFRKNFFAGFGYSYTFFLISALLHLVVFIVPYIILVGSLAFGFSYISYLAGIAIILIHFQRWLLDTKNKWYPVYGLLHPLGVLWFQWLGITVLRDRISDRRVKWKGRLLIGK
jgi:chlorobactene glucosyltransferase